MSFIDFMSRLYYFTEKIEVIAQEGFKDGSQYLLISSGPSIYDMNLKHILLDGTIFKTVGMGYMNNDGKHEKITNFNALEELKIENIIVKLDVIWSPLSNSKGMNGLIELGNYAVKKKEIIYSDFPEIESHGIKLYLERL